MPSETSNIELKSVTADGFSIFDNIDVRPLASFLASFTSFARCTKESANQSIPKLHANSKSILSFLDRAAVGIIVCEHLYLFYQRFFHQSLQYILSDFWPPTLPLDGFCRHLQGYSH